MSKSLSTEEALAQTFCLTYKHLKESTILTANMFEHQYKCIGDLIDIHLSSEPCKIFKKSHKKWEDELIKLKTQYDKAFDNYLDECNELIEIDALVHNI